MPVVWIENVSKKQTTTEASQFLPYAGPSF
jgi:hypothetical protein